MLGDVVKGARGGAEALAAWELAGGTAPGSWAGLSPEDRMWLMAARLYPLDDVAAQHPHPLVSAMGRLRLAQVNSRFQELPDLIREIAETFREVSTATRNTLGAAALLSVSRLALRAGAWRLLAALLPSTLGLVRSTPQERRLSVATGLLGEWALAVGDVRAACLYTSESLFHGSERQRLRGYLGLAYAMASCWDRARLLCEEAWAAQNLQLDAAPKAPFGALNLIRIDALRAIAEKSPLHLESARRRFELCRTIFQTSRSRVPETHSRLALLLANQAVEADVDPAAIENIGRGLAAEGRWRDCLLLDPHGDAWLPTDAAALIGRLDDCASLFTLPPPWRIDFPSSQLAAAKPRHTTENGLPTVLFCI